MTSLIRDTCATFMTSLMQIGGNIVAATNRVGFNGCQIWMFSVIRRAANRLNMAMWLFLFCCIPILRLAVLSRFYSPVKKLQSHCRADLDWVPPSALAFTGKARVRVRQPVTSPGRTSQCKTLLISKWANIRLQADCCACCKFRRYGFHLAPAGHTGDKEENVSLPSHLLILSQHFAPPPFEAAEF